MSKFFPEEIRFRDIKTGDHVLRVGGPIDREYQPANRAERRCKDKSTDAIERLQSRLPDYDTGYMYVEKYDAGDGTGTYAIVHRLGRIPTRVMLYYSSVEEPTDDKDIVYLLHPVIVSNVGAELAFNSKNKMTLTIGSTAIRGSDTEGYLRIMIWR